MRTGCWPSMHLDGQFASIPASGLSHSSDTGNETLLGAIWRIWTPPTGQEAPRAPCVEQNRSSRTLSLAKPAFTTEGGDESSDVRIPPAALFWRNPSAR